MKRVIGYIRVSTDNQDLERQRVLIRKYCENKGYSLLRIEETMPYLEQSATETD